MSTVYRIGKTAFHLVTSSLIFGQFMGPCMDRLIALTTFERYSQMLSDDQTRSLQQASFELSLLEARHLVLFAELLMS